MLKQIKGLKGASVLKAQEQKNIQGGGNNIQGGFSASNQCISIRPTNGNPCTIPGGQGGCCNNGVCDTSGNTTCR